jgi:hypothetical protein
MVDKITAGYFRFKSKNRKKSGRKTDFFPLKIEKTEKKRKSGSDEISLDRLLDDFFVQFDLAA